MKYTQYGWRRIEVKASHDASLIVLPVLHNFFMVFFFIQSIYPILICDLTFSIFTETYIQVWNPICFVQRVWSLCGFLSFRGCGSKWLWYTSDYGDDWVFFKCCHNVAYPYWKSYTRKISVWSHKWKGFFKVLKNYDKYKEDMIWKRQAIFKQSETIFWNQSLLLIAITISLT